MIPLSSLAPMPWILEHELSTLYYFSEELLNERKMHVIVEQIRPHWIAPRPRPTIQGHDSTEFDLASIEVHPA